MGKRGQLGTGGVIILVLITVLILAYWFGPDIPNTIKPFFSLFGVGEADAAEIKPTTLSPAELAFESFLMSYETCKNENSDDCVCDEFNTNEIPNGYSIELENLNGKTRIDLHGNKPTSEKSKVIDNDNLCLYEYGKSTKKFSEKNTNKIILNPQGNNKPYQIDNKIQLFKLDGKHTCFVSGTYESKVFDEITKSRLKCNLKDIGVKAARLAMIDLSDHTGDYPSGSFIQSKNSEASKIIENLRTFLLHNIGAATRITEAIGTKQGRFERRQNMFNDAYNNFDKNNDKKINDDVYFISIRALQLEKEKSKIKKDYFKIHYLQGSSEGKILAEKIKSKLGGLNGKLIVDDKEFSIAEASEGHRFDFVILLEENSKDNIGPVFLTCTQSYSNFIACKENTLIPSVFIDIVEVKEKENNHDIFAGHYKTIAKRIYEGIKDYLTEKGNI